MGSRQADSSGQRGVVVNTVSIAAFARLRSADRHPDTEEDHPVRAAVITALTGPDAVEVRDVPDPVPQPGQAVVDVEFAGVVFPDVLQTRGEYQLRPELPFTPGWEVAGVVRNDAGGLRAGQRVRGKPAPGPASVRRLHATLRSALTSAHRQQLVAFNAAANLDLPAAARQKVRPWEPAELGRFLDSIGGNRLAPLFELIAATGLRRGEACGLRWSDVDLGRGVVVVRQQLVQVTVDEHMPKCTCCGEVHKGLMIGPPKTKAGESRAVELDGGTIGVLLAHKLTQDAERLEWGSAYTDHGLVFARENGSPLPLDHVTKRFHELAVAAGLRPIRLHDLRHGAASLMLAAGVDLALVSKRLGHSSISITSDTYSHLLEGVGREAAERAAALVPRNRGDQPVTNPPKSVGKSLTEEGGYPQVERGAPRGNRTPNPLIKRRITSSAVLTCVFAGRVRASGAKLAAVG